MLCAFAVMAAAGLAYYVLCVWENKRRDRSIVALSTDPADEPERESEDVTDWENRAFRYTY